MKKIQLKIFDETLRDGEQQAGLIFSYKEKMELANLIANTGVHFIDVMPAIDESEKTLVKNLVDSGLGDVIVPATMMGKVFINQSISCGVNRIILFSSVSDRLLFIRDREILKSRDFDNKTIDDDISPQVIDKIRSNMLANIVTHLKYAHSQKQGIKIDFAAEDASRADLDFLVECMRAFGPYIENFMLCDTVGNLDPETAFQWVSDLSSRSENLPIAVHFHNDKGMALENTFQAIRAGASMVSGTFLGIGERAGNVALEQVLFGLRDREGIEVEGINYDALTAVTKYLEKLGAHPASPYTKAASRHETGIHINGILRDPRSYSIFPDEEPEIWFGKCSGASNFEYVFEKVLGIKASQDDYNSMRAQIKKMSVAQGRCFSTADIIQMQKEGIFDFKKL